MTAFVGVGSIRGRLFLILEKLDGANALIEPNSEIFQEPQPGQVIFVQVHEMLRILKLCGGLVVSGLVGQAIALADDG